MAEFSIRFLGTGTSVGVPVIGCDCEVCQSQDPRNNRTRSSVVVHCGDSTVLVDTGPDLREQALREKLSSIDAVFYTHAHLDHVAGFDELRAFCWRRPHALPIHATPACMDTLRSMFGWAFLPENHRNAGYVRPDPRTINGPIRIGGLEISPLPVIHAHVDTIGFLFEHGTRRVAYLPDVKTIPDATLGLIHGVDHLIVDALRPTEHPTHFTIAEALTLAHNCKARQTWLTHLGHENDHATLAASLPRGVAVAHDGLLLEVLRG